MVHNLESQVQEVAHQTILQIEKPEQNFDFLDIGFQIEVFFK
jgi:hypothetical protein